MTTLTLILILRIPVQAGDASFDPPPDSALLARIESLPSNTWMKLPPFKVTGELDWLSARADERKRGPFGRSYCNHAYWAPERQRALFCGGGHNVRPINDVWEYDLAANTWVCLRGADPPFAATASWFRENAMLKAGIVATKTGAPVRMHHQWDQVTYDPERKLLLYVDSMPRSLTYNVKLDQAGNALEQGLGMMHDELTAKLGPDGIYIWGLDAAKRKWTHIEFVVNWKGPGNTIGGRQESGILEYLPDKKTVWFSGYGGALLRDPVARNWMRLPGTGRTYGAVGAYDQNTQTLIAIRGAKTSAYTLDGSGWRTLIEEGPAKGNDSNCTLHYDPVAKRIVMFSAAASPNLWLYDVASSEWTDPKPRGDVPTEVSGDRMIVYYDVARNVHVYYDARETWVYRCRR